MVDNYNPLCDYVVVGGGVKKNATEQMSRAYLEDNKQRSHNQGSDFHFHNLICQRQEYEVKDQQIKRDISYEERMEVSLSTAERFPDILQRSCVFLRLRK